MRRQFTSPLIVIVLLAAVGCERVATVKTPKIYDKDGIHFKHPGNWKVITDSQRDGVRFLFLETPGNATVAIQIYLATEALEIEDFARQFSSNVQKEMPRYVTVGNSTFGGPDDVGGCRSMTEQFSLSTLGEEVPHIRLYKQKQFGDKIVYVICQVSNEDEDFVDVGFDQIMSSLKYDSAGKGSGDTEGATGKLMRLVRSESNFLSRTMSHYERARVGQRTSPVFQMSIPQRPCMNHMWPDL